MHWGRAFLAGFALVLAAQCSVAGGGPYPDSAGLTPTPAVRSNLILGGAFEQGEGSYPGVGRRPETNDAEPHPGVDFPGPAIRSLGYANEMFRRYGLFRIEG